MFDGEAWVDLPNDRDTARTLLDFTVEHGYPESAVRTSEDGYFVPVAIADQLYPSRSPQEA